MNKNNELYTKIFSVVFLLLINNFSLIRLGVPTSITLGKIGMLILVICIIMNFRNNKVLKVNLIFILNYLVFLIVYLISTILNTNEEFHSLLINYIEILAILTLSALIINKNFNLILFIKIVTIGSFIINSFVLSDIILNIGISGLSNPSVVRDYLIYDFKFRALNVLMNGLLFMSFFSFGILYKKQYWGKALYYLSFINVIIFLLLAVLSGSRQTLVGIIMFLVILSLFNLSWKKIKFSSVIKIFLLTLFGYSIINFVFSTLGISLVEWIKHRFGEGEINSVEDIDSRVIIANEGINTFINGSNMFFGYGMDGFSEEMGMNAHNGFLKILFETGLVGILIFVVLLIYYFGKSFRNILILKKRRLDFNYYLSSLIFTSLLIFTFVMNMFKEVFEYHYFWILFLILLSSFHYKIRSNLKSEEDYEKY